MNNDETVILELDLGGWYFHTLKDSLINKFLKELGVNKINIQASNKREQEYYEKLGFKQDVGALMSFST